MTLQDALAIHLYLQAVDTIEGREERVCDAAWKIIERQARKAIGSFPKNGPVQEAEAGATATAPAGRDFRRAVRACHALSGDIDVAQKLWRQIALLSPSDRVSETSKR